MTEDKSLTLGNLLSHLILPIEWKKSTNSIRSIKTRMWNIAQAVADSEPSYDNISLLDMGLAGYKNTDKPVPPEEEHAAMIEGTKKLVEAVKAEYADDQKNSDKVKTLDHLLDAAKHFYEIPLTSASEMLATLIDKHPDTFSIEGYEGPEKPARKTDVEQKELNLPPTCEELLRSTAPGKSMWTVLDNAQKVLDMMRKYRKWSDLRLAIAKRFDLEVSHVRFGPARSDAALEKSKTHDIVAELQSIETKLQEKANTMMRAKNYEGQAVMVEKLKDLDADLRVIQDIKDKWCNGHAGAKADAS